MIKLFEDRHHTCNKALQSISLDVVLRKFERQLGANTVE